MSKKKTREQKIRSSERSVPRTISYSIEDGMLTREKSKTINTVAKSGSHDLRKILFASAAIFIFDVALYILLSNGIITLGILGY